MSTRDIIGPASLHDESFPLGGRKSQRLLDQFSDVVWNLLRHVHILTDETRPGNFFGLQIHALRPLEERTPRLFGQFVQFFRDSIGESLQGVGAEIEVQARGGEKFGQRFASSETQRLDVQVNCLALSSFKRDQP